ncbi:hypothetical protein HDU91_006249 [Kappamyces sp. JEL0680]|nr:hypothetical protein HDU91_006249 [Kappamyces sp. JEL0680]
MSFFKGMRQIQPNLKKDAKKLSFTAVQPSRGDWLMVGILCVCSVPLAWYTTKHLHYALACTLFYWILAYSLIDDTFETVIDKEKNVVEITKTKTGRMKWKRVAIADELINVTGAGLTSVGRGSGRGGPRQLVVQVRPRADGRLQLEFMSDFGYYNLDASETTVLGETNKQELEKLAVAIRKFMDLRPLPEKLKEASLRKHFPTSMTKTERDAIRKQK